MRRERLLVVAVVTLVLSVHSRAQTGTTADGVDAFLRADYARAAAILKPLAETPWQPDQRAAFFMAVLYESGLGVSPDPVRACALFVRASISHDTPLGTAAMELIPARSRTLGRDEFETCLWRASAGFDDRFEPVTFMLDQGHWIAFDVKGTTIAYQGVEKRINAPFGPSYVRFVSIRHAALDAGATFSTRRHFVDIFKWVALAQAHTWSLRWDLIEVVRDQLVPVTSHPLITATGDEPPGRSALDLESLVRLRVNEAGDPEFSVLTGTERQTTVIESDAEREEWKRYAAQQRRAGQEAPDQPPRTLDLHRRPSLAYSAEAAGGCGNVFVYGWTADRGEVIAVRVDKNLLQMSTGGTFDLAKQLVGLDVQVHIYGRARASFPFCTDVGFRDVVEEVWRPMRGTVTVELVPGVFPVRAPYLARATIRISGAQFVSTAGDRVDQMQPITLTAIVGGMAG